MFQRAKGKKDTEKESSNGGDCGLRVSWLNGRKCISLLLVFLSLVYFSVFLTDMIDCMMMNEDSAKTSQEKKKEKENLCKIQELMREQLQFISLGGPDVHAVI